MGERARNITRYIRNCLSTSSDYDRDDDKPILADGKKGGKNLYSLRPTYTLKTCSAFSTASLTTPIPGRYFDGRFSDDKLSAY